MSQRIFHHSHTGLTILTGWDRPLQYLFLVVERAGDDGLGPEIVWSNLELKAQMQTIAEIRAHLSTFGILLPNSVKEGLVTDMANNAGNLVVNHGIDPS